MTNSRILILLFYLLSAVWAVGQIFFWDHHGIRYVVDIAIALVPTFWFLSDIAKRGSFVPHILHPAVLLAWPIVVPIYVIATRRIRGFLLVCLHAIGMWSVNLAFFYGTLYLVWGPEAFQ